MFGIALALQFKPVQSWASRQAADFLSQELGAKIEIKSLYFKPFSSLTLEGLFVSDQAGDTLLYSKSLHTNFDLSKIFKNQISVHSAKLEHAFFNLKTLENGETNLKFLLTYFANPKPNKQKLSVRLNAKKLDLIDVEFRYINSNGQLKHLPNVINFDYLLAKNISAQLRNMGFENDIFSGEINQLQLAEQSGFRIESFTGKFDMGPQHIQLSDLLIETNKSKLTESFRMEFEKLTDFHRFMTLVRIDWHPQNAYIDSEDIEFFSSDMKRVKFKTHISGQLSGTVSDFDADIKSLQLGQSSSLSGNAHVIGLPDIQNTWFEANLQHVHSNVSELEYITAGFSNRPNFTLPNFLHNLEQIEYQGNWAGYYHNFDMQGAIKTALGNIQTDLNIQINDQTAYTGYLYAEEFDIGRLLEQPDLQNSTFEIQLDGAGLTKDKLNGHFTADIPMLDYKNYRYRNLTTEGTLLHQTLKGKISVQDPNIQLQAEGTIQFEQAFTKLAAHANIQHIVPSQLHWMKDKDFNFSVKQVETNIQWSNLEDLTGNFQLENANIQVDNVSFPIEQFKITAEEAFDSRSLEASKNIQIQSDVLDLDLQGQIEWNSLEKFFYNFYIEHSAEQNNLQKPTIGLQNFALQATVKNTDVLWKIFNDKVYVKPGTQLTGYFSSTEKNLNKLKIKLPEVRYADFYGQNIELVAFSNEAKGLQTQFRGQNTGAFKTIRFHSLEIDQTLKGNQIAFEIKLAADTSTQNSIHLKGLAKLNKDLPTQIQLGSSTILLNNLPWTLAENSRLFWTKDYIQVENLEISQQNQKLIAHGHLSKDPNKKLNLDFQAFDIASLNPFLIDDNIELGGILDGESQVFSVFNNPFALASLNVSDLSLNQVPLGILKLKADFDQNKNLIHLNLDIVKDLRKRLDLYGTFNYLKENDQLDLIAKFQDLEVKFLEPLLAGLVSHVRGDITGETTVKGNWRHPKFTGQGFANSIAFTVNYLGTPYQFSGPIQVEESKILFKNLKISDPKNQQATLNGSIDLNNIRSPWIHAQFDTQNFLVLNTTLKDNNLYHGTAYATGIFNFVGRPSEMKIDIQAKTDDQTLFNIPLNYSSNLGDHEFIRFVVPETTQNTKTADNKEIDLTKGLTLNMDLSVTPSAETRIITDLGELTGRGNGQITLRISTLGDFEMFGDYQINSGKFNFSAQDFINKIFEIRQGGNIRWTGRPSEASINLTAYYEQRTNLSALYNAAGAPSNEQRVLTQAEMFLNGNLLRPQIQFGLNFPNDPYVKDELQSYLSDANNVNQQTLSLIVRRSFMPNSSSAQGFGREVNSTLLGAGTEIAFNQLTNILSESLNLNFIDFQIRSLNDASGSLRLFKDRLILTGGISDRRTEQIHDLNVFSNQIETDAELRYLIRPDGRLTLRVSNKLNTRHFLLNPTDEYISAVGLIYRQEFNSFEEFFNRMLFRKMKKQKESLDN